MHLFCIFSVNGLREVVKQFYSIAVTVMLLFRFIHTKNKTKKKKKHTEHVNTFISIPNSGV